MSWSATTGRCPEDVAGDEAQDDGHSKVPGWLTEPHPHTVVGRIRSFSCPAACMEPRVRGAFSLSKEFRGSTLRATLMCMYMYCGTRKHLHAARFGFKL